MTNKTLMLEFSAEADDLFAIAMCSDPCSPTWRAASTQVPPTYMEGPWTSERIISFYVAEKKKYFGTLANEVVW